MEQEDKDLIYNPDGAMDRAVVVKLNADHYIHQSISKIQDCLMKDDPEMGFSQYIMMVEHLEALCAADNRIPKDYDDKVKQYIESEDYKGFQGKETIKLAKHAMFKFKLLVAEVFKRNGA